MGGKGHELPSPLKNVWWRLVDAQTYISLSEEQRVCFQQADNYVSKPYIFPPDLY